MQFRPRIPTKTGGWFIETAREGLRRWRTLPLVKVLRRGLSLLANAGTAGYPPDVKRRLKILNMIAYLVATTTLIYAIQLTIADLQRFLPVVVANFAIITAALSVPLLHRVSEIAGGLMLIFTEYVALQVFTWFFSTAGGGHLQYIILAAAAFVVFGLGRTRMILALVALAFGLHLYAAFNYAPTGPLPESEQAMMQSLYVQGALTTFGLIAASVYYAFSLVEQAKAETDSLLRHILPDSIVERLKSKPEAAIADSFEEASILFADITGFVAMARDLGAERTVALLNALVSEFDALAERHGVEKIKTIGDAYMAASGIPEPVPDHTVRLARFGVDILAVVARLNRERNLDLNLRIGLAAGPVMAGVIGTNKFSYDVWGNAVNLAARLENLGTPGRIHICPTCRSRLDGHFSFESRGESDIRGVGRRETWLVGVPVPG